MNDAGEMSAPDVPPDWELVRLKYAVDSIETGNRDSSFRPSDDDPGILSIGGEHFDSQGEWRLDSPRYISTDTYHSMKRGKLKQGDTLLVKDGATIGKTAYVNEVPENRAAANEHVYVIRPSQMVASRLVAYQLSSQWVQRQIQLFIRGSAQSGLPSTFADGVLLSCPPPREQSTIVDFLDRRTARIDALVAKQKRLLDLLDEKRQTFITRAVTAGLDSTVATKNTGVEWLGEIPEQWEPIRLKFLLTEIEQGWSPQCKDRPAGPDQWGVLKAGAANKGRFHENENKILPSDREPKSEYEIQQGDLLMNRASGSPKYLGSVALVPEVRSQLLLCDKLFRLRVREGIASPEFLSLALRSHPLRHQIIAAISGAEGLANNLPQAEVKELTLAVPPSAEQEQITKEVLDWEAQVESLMQKTTRIIDLLQEKRQALITAAVTGQIDGIEERSEPHATHR